MNFKLTAFVEEEVLHQLGTIIGEDAADQFGARMKRRTSRLATAIAALLIGSSEYDAAYLSPVQRSGAHAAGFDGDIERGLGQVFTSEGIEGGGEGDHFSVSGGIAEFFGHVVTPGNDLVVHDHHGPDGHFIVLKGLPGFAQGQLHVVLVGHRDGFV